MIEKYVVRDIKYDVSENGEWDDAVLSNLPEKLVIPIDRDVFIDLEEVEDQLSEEISNITGSCHEGFSYALTVE